MTNSFGMSKPMYFTGTSTLTASGLRSSAQTSSDAGWRPPRFLSSHESVSPESMMSSSTSTCLPVMSRSRSLRMRTTPEELVADQEDLLAGVVVGDLRRELADLLLDLLLGEQHVVDVRAVAVVGAEGSSNADGVAHAVGSS